MDTKTGLNYGLLGLPLAFVSLPLYVSLPRFYAEHLGVPLAYLGAILLGTRLLDALFDPFIGRWIDRRFQLSQQRVWQLGAMAAAGMSLGFAALWTPASSSTWHTLAWLSMALTLTYLSYSVVAVMHQAWGARWGGTPAERVTIVSWREGAALMGVLVASVLPMWLGWTATSLFLATALCIGLACLRQTSGAISHQHLALAPDPGINPKADVQVRIWQQRPFVALLAVFLANGAASALPATLLPFFVRDVLQAPTWEGPFLLVYFLAAAVSLPAWRQGAARWGLARCWQAGMLLTVAAFCLVPWLGQGDTLAFAVICAATGFALGADLAMPSAILTGVIHQSGQAGQAEGQFYGWWACATKLNLALAAGVALPALAWLGYETGTRDPASLQTLSWLYAALPCGIKTAAVLALTVATKRYPVLKGHA